MTAAPTYPQLQLLIVRFLQTLRGSTFFAALGGLSWGFPSVFVVSTRKLHLHWARAMCPSVLEGQCFLLFRSLCISLLQTRLGLETLEGRLHLRPLGMQGVWQ